jgi:D-hydroxyproline dehydrogenase subunit alpha
MANHPRDYEYEVVVLGGGPAGIAAACAAGESGCRVALLETAPWLGGPHWQARPDARLPRLARRWLRRLERSSVEVFDHTTAIGFTRPDVLHTERSNDVLNIGWHALILATGAQGLCLPFPGWTLPHVGGVGGLPMLGQADVPVAGKCVIVAGTGPLALAVAADLARRGARVTDILEQASWRSLSQFARRLPRLAPGKVGQALGLKRRLWRTHFRAGCWPVEAQGADRVQSVTFTNGARSWTRACDYLTCAFGLTPSLQWPMLLNCRIEEDAVWVDPWQRTSVSGVFCAGAATGIAGVDCALVEGRIAGLAAAGHEQAAERLFAARARHQRFARAMREAFALRAELLTLATDQTVICRCEEVTWQDIQSYDDLRSAKLQTRCGMGSCQGRVCHSALRVLKGWPADSVRPPLLPTHIGSFVGTSNELKDTRR